MKLRIIWITLCFITAVNAECKIKTRKMDLDPIDGKSVVIMLENVKSFVEWTENEYVKIEHEASLTQATVILQNMEKQHKQQESVGNKKGLDVNVTLECTTGTTSTTEIQIYFNFVNVYPPMLISHSNNEVVYTLPMPFPPNVNLCWFNDTIVEDWDMYNSGIEAEIIDNYYNFNISVIPDENSLNKKFKVCLEATNMIHYDTSLTLDIKDKPPSAITPKNLSIKVNIKKNSTSSMLSFDKPNYSGTYNLDLERNGLITTANIDSNSAKVEVFGDYEDCFTCNNNKGIVEISSKPCTNLPYGETYLNLELEATSDDSTITASAGLFISIKEKHFEKEIYAGIFDNGNLDINDIKLIGAKQDVEIDVVPNDSKLICTKKSCPDNDCVISCNVARFEDSLLEAELTAFNSGETSKTSTQIIINNVENTFKFDNTVYNGNFDIDRTPIGRITTARINANKADVSITGDYEDCFEATNTNGQVEINSKKCTLPYDKTYLDLQLVGKITIGTSSTTTKASLVLAVLQKHFEKPSYIGTAKDGVVNLEDIKLSGAGHIKVETNNPMLDCKEEVNPCPNGDCIIKCTVSGEFEDTVLTAKVTVYTDDKDSGVSVMVVITNELATNIGGGGGSNDGEDNTGLIAAVSVLAVLLVGVLIGGAFFFHRQRKSIAKDPLIAEATSATLSTRKNSGKPKPDSKNTDKDTSLNLTPLNSPKLGLEKKIEFTPTTATPIRSPTPPLLPAELSKPAEVTPNIQFVKKPNLDRDSIASKYDRRATGYPLNPPSINELDTADYAPSEGSILPPYSFQNKDDDLESVMTDATADTTKSVSFNPTVKHSVLFEDIND